MPDKNTAVAVLLAVLVGLSPVLYVWGQVGEWSFRAGRFGHYPSPVKGGWSYNYEGYAYRYYPKNGTVKVYHWRKLDSDAVGRGESERELIYNATINITLLTTPIYERSDWYLFMDWSRNVTEFIRDYMTPIPAEKAYEWIQEVMENGSVAKLKFRDQNYTIDKDERMYSPPQPVPGATALYASVKLWFGAHLYIVMYPTNETMEPGGYHFDFFTFIYGTVDNLSEWWKGVGRVMMFHGVFPPTAYLGNISVTQTFDNELVAFPAPDIEPSLKWFPERYKNPMIKVFYILTYDRKQDIIQYTVHFMDSMNKDLDLHRGTVKPGPGWVRWELAPPTPDDKALQYKVRINKTQLPLLAGAPPAPPGEQEAIGKVFAEIARMAGHQIDRAYTGRWMVVLDEPWLYQMSPPEVDELYWYIVGRPAFSFLEHLTSGDTTPNISWEDWVMKELLIPSSPVGGRLIDGDGVTPVSLAWSVRGQCVNFALDGEIIMNLVFDRPTALIGYGTHLITGVVLPSRAPIIKYWINRTFLPLGTFYSRPFPSPWDMDGDNKSDWVVITEDIYPSMEVKSYEARLREWANKPPVYAGGLAGAEYIFYPGSHGWLGTMMNKNDIDIAVMAGILDYNEKLPPALTPPGWWLFHYTNETPSGNMPLYMVPAKKAWDPCFWLCDTGEGYAYMLTLPVGGGHYGGWLDFHFPDTWRNMTVDEVYEVFKYWEDYYTSPEVAPRYYSILLGHPFVTHKLQVVGLDLIRDTFVWLLEQLYGSLTPPHNPTPPPPAPTTLEVEGPTPLDQLWPDADWRIIDNPRYDPLWDDVYNSTYGSP